MIVSGLRFEGTFCFESETMKFNDLRRFYSWEKETEEPKEVKSGEDPTENPDPNMLKRIKKRRVRNSQIKNHTTFQQRTYLPPPVG